MTATQELVVHQEPVWRDRANFVINAELSEKGPHLFEQLWARQLGEDKFGPGSCEPACALPLHIPWTSFFRQPSWIEW